MPDRSLSIYVMTVASFVLLILSIVARIVRIVVVILLFLWIKLLQLIDVIVYLFRRVFSPEPDKVNQNPDYSHIESKYCLDWLKLSYLF